MIIFPNEGKALFKIDEVSIIAARDFHDLESDDDDDTAARQQSINVLHQKLSPGASDEREEHDVLCNYPARRNKNILKRRMKHTIQRTLYWQMWSTQEIDIMILPV